MAVLPKFSLTLLFLVLQLSILQATSKAVDSPGAIECIADEVEQYVKNALESIGLPVPKRTQNSTSADDHKSINPHGSDPIEQSDKEDSVELKAPVVKWFKKSVKNLKEGGFRKIANNSKKAAGHLLSLHPAGKIAVSMLKGPSKKSAN